MVSDRARNGMENFPVPGHGFNTLCPRIVRFDYLSFIRVQQCSKKREGGEAVITVHSSSWQRWASIGKTISVSEVCNLGLDLFTFLPVLFLLNSLGCAMCTAPLCLQRGRMRLQKNPTAHLSKRHDIFVTLVKITVKIMIMDNYKPCNWKNDTLHFRGWIALPCPVTHFTVR